MLAYSPISAIDRQIEACPQYDKYFDLPKGGKLKKKVLDKNGEVEDTVQQMLNMINNNWQEVKRAKHLVKGATTHQTAKNIFDWLYKHIKYNLEKGEILNTPSASYYYGQVLARQNPEHTEKYPVDCDDFTIFACSFLKAHDLPWALRIASYDGNKFSHVYCIVPKTKDNEEIIIDPVYIGFNKEKQYKMQKTFYGNLNGLSGMPIYYQGVNGTLSGIGNSDNTDVIIDNLAGGAHFEGFGLSGEMDENRAIAAYLKDTLKVARRRPNLVGRMYKNPARFCNMLDTAIKGLDTDEEAEILDILAQQEKDLIRKAQAMSGFGSGEWFIDENPEEQELSGLNYNYIDGERYYNFDGLGFFGTLGLFKKLIKRHRAKKTARLVKKGKTKKLAKVQKRWVKRDVRREKVKKAVRKVGQKIVKVLNKVNPVTVAARNGLRVLVAINFFGLASKLKEDEAARKKVLDLFEKMGGNKSKMQKSIDNGSKKKPLLKKTGSVKINDGFEGFGELGAVAAVSGLLSVAGKIVEKIFTWFKKKKAEKAAKTADDRGERMPGDTVPGAESLTTTPVLSETKEKPKFLTRVANFVKDTVVQLPQNNSINNQDATISQENMLVPVNNNLPINQTPIINSSLPLNQNPAQSSALKKYGWIAAVAGGAGALWYFSRQKKQAQPVSGLKKLKAKRLK